MIDKARFQIGRRNGAWPGWIIGLAFVALVIAAWFTAPVDSAAVAAEVDAIGAPAPVGFADIIERVKPAVVRVRVKIEEQVSPGEQESPFPPGSPFDRFFRRFGIPLPQKPVPKSGFALGSGFFISGDGYIVTNNHVVANGKSFEVTTDSGTTYQAKVIGTDPQTDLALIKISVNADLPYVRLASAVPRIGDWVLPIGNPFGLGGTVTAGIVSARGRNIGEGPYDDFIQIDAPVNVGNSGGPTFNTKGEVIGVNTAIYSPSGGSVGVAFDVPAETVKFVIQQLKDKGYVTRGWIGVQIQSVTPAIADAIGLKNIEGALVAHVEPDSPAAKGGIEVGDVITSVNGEAVKESRDLGRKIAAIAPGTATKLDVFRNGQEKTITVTLGKFPRPSTEAKAEEQKAPSETTVLGLTLAPASAIAGAGEHGVVIIEIDPSGRAAESGLQRGDVILDVGRRAVNTPAEVRKMVEEARSQSKKAVLLRVQRGDTTIFVAVPIG
ncbi:MAG: Do family serine endopeptidase [Steroidobacteraceae bacterium]